MTEILEYCLVVMVSSLFVAGSVATYGSFSEFVSEVQFKAAASTVSALAMEALANGTSQGAVALPPSTISCDGGVLAFSSGSQVAVEDLHTSCSFELSVQSGMHEVAFSANGSGLSAEVE
ncbi:MAG: hypothetical protein JRN59_03155 [Nitrososphaerota archaeon]|jgi:hypothetical protein|nr:hypothetical protein [Nitrososphaerota archaeon]